MNDRTVSCPRCDCLITVKFPGPAFVLLPGGYEPKDVETTKSGLLIAHKTGMTMYWSPMHQSWQVLL